MSRKRKTVRSQAVTESANHSTEANRNGKAAKSEKNASPYGGCGVGTVSPLIPRRSAALMAAA